MSYLQIQDKLNRLADKEKARVLQRFFKTGPGEYGEGDMFLGISVPVLRKLAQEYGNILITDALQLLRSPIHECRLLALILLIRLFERGDPVAQKRIYRLYLKHTRFINSWDLVDISAPHIVGSYLTDKDRSPLYKLAKARHLWDRRIAIVATFTFIRQHDFADTLRISHILLQDEQELIHKAVGWMLREIGKRNVLTEKKFLKKNYARMPRIMLRYAIERFSGREKTKFLHGKIGNT